MQRYRFRNILFAVFIFCVLVYGVHYEINEGFFTGTKYGKVPNKKILNTPHNALLVHVDHNQNESFKTPVNYQVKDSNGRPSQNVSKERKLGNEPRSRTEDSEQKRMNVLFIMSDDMRAQIGAYDGPDSEYSKPKLHTPHFDELAARSLLLKKAFVQYTYCGPSRTSMLTSRRPDTTGIYTNKEHWRNTRGNYTSLPQYFKENGYSVQGIGKVYHPGDSSGNNDPVSWTEKYKTGGSTEYDYLKPYGPGERWIKVSAEDEIEKPLPDRTAVKHAIEYLTSHVESSDKPFFLGFGFNKPHVSLICPQKYYDLYPEETADQFLSELSWQKPLFRPGSGIINGTILNGSWSQLPTETLRQFRQAYFACISYVDDLLGELLGALDELGLSETTVVSFIADHGYHLGEQNMVGKQTLYDSSSHVPMMVRVPGRTDQGVVSSSVVEALDIFPTIVEAAGLPPVQPCREPSEDIPLCTEGASVLPLIDEPHSEVKPYAITQQFDPPDRMRFSLRSARYRFTMCFWRDQTESGMYVYRPMEQESRYYTMQLYDHDKDREERFNVANDQLYEAVRDVMTDDLYEALNIKQSDD